MLHVADNRLGTGMDVDMFNTDMLPPPCPQFLKRLKLGNECALKLRRHGEIFLLLLKRSIRVKTANHALSRSV
jgi:hypothetical protein